MKWLSVPLCLALIGCAGRSTLWAAKSPDRRHSLELVEHSGAQYLAIDGVDGQAHQAIAPLTLTFSSDGQHLAYAAQDTDRWRVFVDHCPRASWDGVGELSFAADGRHLAYAAETAGKWRVVVDEKPGPTFAAVLAGSLQLSADGRHVAYVAGGPPWHAVVDGVIGPPFDGIARLTLAADGARHVYAGRRGPLAQIVIGDYRSQSFDAIKSLALATDGAQVAWLAQSGSLDRLFLNGVALETVPGSVRASSLAFRPRATSPSYVLEGADGRFVGVIDGEPSEPFDELEHIVFSADGARTALVGKRGPFFVVSIDGVQRSERGWVDKPVFSADGKRVAYLTRRGRRSAVVVDGHASSFDLVLEGSIAFSRDSRHWACVAGDGARKELFFAVDGRRTGALDFREITFAATRETERLMNGGLPRNVFAIWAAAEAERVASPSSSISPLWASGRCAR
jgi:hypothetical protein